MPPTISLSKYSCCVSGKIGPVTKKSRMGEKRLDLWKKNFRLEIEKKCLLGPTLPLPCTKTLKIFFSVKIVHSMPYRRVAYCVEVKSVTIIIDSCIKRMTTC